MQFSGPEVRFLVPVAARGYSAGMMDATASPEPDAPEVEVPALEAWAERYLDLFQRNWTAWLESTPAMIRAAMDAAEREPSENPEAEIHDLRDYERNR